MKRRGIPRLGFVGVGWIGRHRMASLLKNGAAEAVAVFDASPEAANEACRLAPGAQRVQDFAEMLDLDLDGVVIATPNALHAEQSIAALKRGLHVFCQKPLGRSAGEVREIIQAAHENDRVLGVDLSYRHVEAMRRVKELVRDGEIGEVFAADLVFHNAYGPDRAWFYDRDLAGGGCLLDLGIHLVDLGLWVLDFPRIERVSGRLYSHGRPLKSDDCAVEDYALARLDLSNDATLQVACSWRVSAGCDAIIGATFHGTKGSVRMGNVGGSFYDFRAERLHGTRAQSLVEPPEDWSGRAIEDWARRTIDAPRFDPEMWRHVDVMEAIDRVYAG